MRVRFWGTRGSIPTPGPATVRYGGNTSCVEVRSSRGTLVVLDCGTGARLLGRHLSAEAAASRVAPSGSILIGHTHWDHIQGLPFFEPLFRPGARFDIYGPRGLGSSMAQTMAGQMQYQYFPVSVEQLGATVDYHDLVEGSFAVDDLVVTTQYLNHPALTLGYRIDGDGASLVYLCDHEPHDRDLAGGGDLLASPEDTRHVTFMADADVVIHDAQYVAAEYADKVGWGHSTMEFAVDAACLASARHLVLTHHDPSRDDDQVDAIVAAARRRATGRGVAVDAAAEGMTLEIGTTRGDRVGGEARPATPAAAHHADRAQGLGRVGAVSAVVEVDASIVVATTDEGLADAVRSAADADGLPVRVVTSAAELLDLDLEGRTIVVADVDDFPELHAVAAALSPRVSDAAPVSVVAVTRRRPAFAGAPSMVSDWLVWPATVTHVRTKLRSAVLRRPCRWLAAPRPADEPRRLDALHRLGVLDTPPEERFDRLTAMACRLFAMPMALVSLIDGERQWFKSRQGLDATETDRDLSVCAHAILEPDVLQIPDLLDDPRFADSPATAGDDRARFYAGAPLVLADGSCVGTLCLVDHRPRLLDDGQLDQLRSLAELVVAELVAGAPGRSEGVY